MTHAELESVSVVSRRIKVELKRLFDQLPGHARTGTGLARYLSLDRGTCTRFVNVCRKPLTELEVLKQLPGVKGLEQVFDALESSGLSASDIDLARVASDQYERLIQEFGGSQTKLSERIDETARVARLSDRDAVAQETIERRRALFEAAAGAIGHRVRARIATQIFRPTPGQPGRMDQCMVRGTFGLQSRPGAMPYGLQTFGTNTQAPTVDEKDPDGEHAFTSPEGKAALGLSGDTVLREFSSDPVPLVTMSGGGKFSVTSVDPEKADGSCDIVMAHALLGHWGLPQYDDPPEHEISAAIKHPAERLLFDVFLHRSMASVSIPSVKVFLTSPGLFNNLSAHWYDQLPDTPPLELLNSDAANLPTHVYDRYPELIQTVFDRLEWQMSDFVGFRFEVQYPYWSGYYSMVFDYSAAITGEQARQLDQLPPS